MYMYNLFAVFNLIKLLLYSVGLLKVINCVDMSCDIVIVQKRLITYMYMYMYFECKSKL